MGTYSSVTCAEVPGSCRETADIYSGLSCSIRLQCSWANRYALITDLLTTPRPWPKLASGSLTAYAVNATAQPIGAELGSTSGQEHVPTEAYVDVTYNTSIVDVASETIEPNIESIPLNYTLFNWLASPGQTAPLLEGEAPPMMIPSLNLSRTRYRLNVVHADFIGLVGYCNQSSYTSSLLGMTFAAETLLYLPTPINRSISNLTTSGYTASARFAYKPQGWNKYWHAKSQSWDSIYLSGSATRYIAYPLGDFSNLFA